MQLAMLLFLGLLALASLSGSQSTTASSASARVSTTSTSTAAATHSVSVGADGINFTPNQLNASVGDIVQFRFYPQNHSVARAEYKLPCIPYEYTGAGKVGFWSGFKPTAIVSNDPPLFDLLINDTEPVFFYCSSPDACFEGMIGVINPNTTQTFDTQLNYALNATEEFSPLEYFPSEGPPTRTTTATSLPTSSSIEAGKSHSKSASSSSLSGGSIAGIVIGVLVACLVAAIATYLCGRMRRRKESHQHLSMSIAPSLPPLPPGSYMSDKGVDSHPSSPVVEPMHLPSQLRLTSFSPTPPPPPCLGHDEFRHSTSMPPPGGAERPTGGSDNFLRNMLYSQVNRYPHAPSQSGPGQDSYSTPAPNYHSLSHSSAFTPLQIAGVGGVGGINGVNGNASGLGFPLSPSYYDAMRNLDAQLLFNAGWQPAVGGGLGNGNDDVVKPGATPLVHEMDADAGGCRTEKGMPERRTGSELKGEVGRSFSWAASEEIEKAKAMERKEDNSDDSDDSEDESKIKDKAFRLRNDETDKFDMESPVVGRKIGTTMRF